MGGNPRFYGCPTCSMAHYGPRWLGINYAYVMKITASQLAAAQATTGYAIAMGYAVARGLKFGLRRVQTMRQPRPRVLTSCALGGFDAPQKTKPPMTQPLGDEEFVR